MNAFPGKRFSLHTRAANLLAVVAIVASGHGCEKDGVVSRCGPDAGANCEDAVGKFVDQLAEAMCGWQFRCCSLPEIDLIGTSSYVSESQCRTALVHSLEQHLSEARLASQQGRVTFDPVRAQTCVATVGDAACTDAVSAVLGSVFLLPWDRVAACPSPFAGHKGPGAECFLSDECARGSTCFGGVGEPDSNKLTAGGMRAVPVLGDTFTAMHGHCVTDVGDGETCLSTQECVPGLYCRQADIVCARPAQEGEPCNIPRDSTGAAVAVFTACAETPRPLSCAGGICRRFPVEGEPCLLANGPLGGLCDASAAAAPLVCVGQQVDGTGICKPAGRQGDVCSFGGGIAPCADTLACSIDESDTSGVGTCQPAPAPGAPCSKDGGRCAAPAVCYSTLNLCVVPPVTRDGTHCRSDFDCASLNCAPTGTNGLSGACVPASEQTPICAGRGNSPASGNNPPIDAGTTASGGRGGVAGGGGRSAAGGRIGGGGRSGA